MAVAIFLDTVITRRLAIGRLPGGLVAYRETAWGTHGYPRADDHLVAFSAMSPRVADKYSQDMGHHGIEYERDGRFVDIALVREADLRASYPEVWNNWPDNTTPNTETPIRNLTVDPAIVPCDWLQYGTWGRVFVCWLRGTRPGRLALAVEEGSWPDT